jgi:hypothetical protein
MQTTTLVSGTAADSLQLQQLAHKQRSGSVQTSLEASSPR